MLIYRTPTNNKGCLDKGVVVVLSAAAGGAAGAGRRPLRGSRSLIQSSRAPAHIKLHQDRPRTATNHVSHDVHAQQNFIGRPNSEKRNERKEGRQAPEPEPGTRRSQKITMEHNPLPEKGKKRNVGKQDPEP